TLTVAQRRQPDAERVERVALHRARADLARGDDCPLGQGAGRRHLASEHEDLCLRAEDAYKVRRRWFRRQQIHRLAVGDERSIAVPRLPEVAAEALAYKGRANRVAEPIHELDSLAP